MKQLKIEPLNLKDLPEIKDWESRFSNDPRFKTIIHYILEDNTYYGLDEVIHTNYELCPIGDEERNYALCAKNENNEIVAFVLSCMIDLHTENPELIIKYIVLRPDYHYQGYGYKILNEIVQNSETYFGKNPHVLTAIIEKTNIVSQRLFTKMGCSLRRFYSETYLMAEKLIPEFNNQKEEE